MLVPHQIDTATDRTWQGSSLQRGAAGYGGYESSPAPYLNSRRLLTQQSAGPRGEERQTGGATPSVITTCTLGSGYKSTRTTSPEGGWLTLNRIHFSLLV